jgi:arabinose-5-phosphate isomerase
MYRDKDIPRVSEKALLPEVLLEMSAKRLGFTTIVSQDDPKKLLGIFTDGDLRRTLHRGLDIHKTAIHEVMTTRYQTVTMDMLAHEALHLMEKIKILVFPVLDKDGHLVGAFNMHELFKAGVV